MSFDPDLFGKALFGEPIPEEPKPVQLAPVSLQEQLQEATRLALQHNIEILALPLDTEDKAVLKAKTATANHTLTTQVRVEETKFKARQSEDTLNKLLEIIAEEKKRLGRI